MNRRNAVVVEETDGMIRDSHLIVLRVTTNEIVLLLRSDKATMVRIIEDLLREAAGKIETMIA